jgi:carotenoid cleavage dioxygenase-like enzyme
MLDRTRSSANTNVTRHAGKIFALEEAHFPFEVTPELATKGYSDFARKLTGPFTAHPKVCPVTGELFAFGYSTPRANCSRSRRTSCSGSTSHRVTCSIR